MINPIIKWIANIPWKKVSLITGFLMVVVSSGLIIYGNHLESKRDKLNDEIRELKNKVSETFLILKEVEEDFYKLKDIDLGESTKIPDWLTQDYLDDEYYWNFNLDSSDEESSCLDLRKITQGKIVCNKLQKLELYIQLMRELKSDVFESNAIKKLKDEQEKIQKGIQKDIAQKEKEIPSYGTISTCFFWGAILTIVGVLILFITAIFYVADFINDSRKSINENLEKAQQDLSLSQSPWKNASRVLDAYYQRNLGQSGKIYITSVAVMIAGFIVILVSIIVGINIATREQPNQERQKEIMELLKANNNLEKLSKDRL